jgi:hypothetical protein
MRGVHHIIVKVMEAEASPVEMGINGESEGVRGDDGASGADGGEPSGDGWPSWRWGWADLRGLGLE